MKLYFNSLKLHLKKDMEYKLSFILSFLAQFLVLFSYYFIIISLFTKFDNIKGFTLYEVLLCFAIIQFGFSFNECFARGVDKFDDLIIKGDFDRILLRPKSILLLTLISDSDLVRLSRILQSFIILIISLLNLNISWDIFKILTLLFMLISSVLIFFCVFLLAASYCFLTIQGLEIRNLVTDGGKHMAQYPIGVFKKGFVIFFTFIIPYAFVNYYPLLYFTGKSDNKLFMLSPLLLILYLIPSIKLFNYGSKKYMSTGS